jgi:tripartite-type tricarboxylate transporter receptor subunit TctC
MNRPQQFFTAAFAGAALALCTSALAADPWPTKPITIVVPFGTGSGSDMVSRLYAKFITAETGGTVVVDNRPGANAMIGSQLVARAAPDGYTVLMGSGTANAANYALYADRITYKPESFSTVAVIFVTPPVIFAAPGIAGDTVHKAVAAAKISARGASCGTGNAVTLVACEMLKRLTGTDFVTVSYKGNGQSLADLAGGQITLAIADMAAGSPFVTAGRIRPVAIAAHNRLPTLPGVPSAKEQGLDMDFLSWNAVFVPVGTPEPVIMKLNAAARRMLASPEGEKQRLASAGIEVSGEIASSRKFVADEIDKWMRYVRETSVKVE